MSLRARLPRVIHHASAMALAVLVVATAASVPSATAADRIPGCTSTAHGSVSWDDVQGIADDLEDAIRASPLRHAYTGLSFDQDHQKLDVYFRSHRHDGAVHACAKALKIDRYLRISIHHWSSGQLLRAIRRVEDALPGLYNSQIFECSYGAADRFDIDIYRKATDHDVARIKREAKKTGVAFKIHRLTTDAPEPELQ